MRLDAIAVTSGDMEKTARFYKLLGFEFPAIEPGQQHLEAITKAGEVRLMIDDSALAEKLNGTPPVPATHASFAILCDSPADVDAAAKAIGDAGFRLVVEPWDAFWGQRYATVADPDGYLVDLFAPLPA